MRVSFSPPQGRLRAALSSSEGGFRAALASLLPWKEGRREEKGRRGEGSQSSNQPSPVPLLDHHPSVAEERRRLYRSHTLSCPGEEGRRRKGGEEGRVGVRLRRDGVGRQQASSRAEGLWKRGREREQQKRREEEELRRRKGEFFSVRGSESVGRGEFQRSSKELRVRRVKEDLAMGGETVRLGEGQDENGRKRDDEGRIGGRRDMGGERRDMGSGRKGRERLRRALSLPSSKHRAGRGEVRY